MTWSRPVPQPAGTPYGQRGSLWSSGAHTGLDFPAPTGQAVSAVAPGRVSYAGDTGGAYGIMVKITHRAGLETWYCHLSSVAVRRGSIVGAGDVVGAVGSTGNTTGPHLHLEVRVDGQHRDPAPYLAGAVESGPASPTFPGGITGAQPAGLVDEIAGDTVRNVMLTALVVAGGLALVAVGLARAASPAVEKVAGDTISKAGDALELASLVHPAGRAAGAASLTTKAGKP